MSVPNLDRSLVLEAPERTPDGSGGFIETWRVLGALWAEVSPRTGRMGSEGPALVSRLGLRIVVRGAAPASAARPKPGQRFREGGRVYVISAVTEWDARGRYLLCFADEEVAA